MIAEEIIEKLVKPHRSQSAAIEEYIKSFFDKDISYLDIPKMVFLNGYFYAMVKHQKIVEYQEYLETPFATMFYENVPCLRTRTSTPRIEIFLTKPSEKEEAPSKCFAAGVNYYFTQQLKIKPVKPVLHEID